MASNSIQSLWFYAHMPSDILADLGELPLGLGEDDRRGLHIAEHVGRREWTNVPVSFDDAAHPDDLTHVVDEAGLQTHREGDVGKRSEAQDRQLARLLHDPAHQLDCRITGRWPVASIVLWQLHRS